MNSIKLPCGIEWKNGQELGKSGLCLAIGYVRRPKRLLSAGIQYRSGGDAMMRKTVLLDPEDGQTAVDAAAVELESWLIGEKGADFVKSLYSASGYNNAGAAAVGDTPASHRVCENAKNVVDAIREGLDAAEAADKAAVEARKIAQHAYKAAEDKAIMTRRACLDLDILLGKAEFVLDVLTARLQGG